MDRMSVEDTLFPGCPIRNVLARIGDKWSLLVLYTLDGAEPMRFGTLRKAILEEDGYLTRSIYPEVPPRVEYALTERAKSLLPHINSLIAWAIENMDAIKGERKASREV